MGTMDGSGPARDHRLDPFIGDHVSDPPPSAPHNSCGVIGGPSSGILDNDFTSSEQAAQRALTPSSLSIIKPGPIGHTCPVARCPPPAVRATIRSKVPNQLSGDIYCKL